MTIIGTKLVTAAWPGIEINEANNNQRAIAHDSFVAPSYGYITRLGGFFREVSSNPFAILAVFRLDEDGTPTKMIGRTARFAVNGVGGDFSAPIVWSDPILRGLPTAIHLRARERFAIAIKVDSGILEVAKLPGQTMHWYRDAAGTGIPHTPFLPTGTAQVSHIAFYADFTENENPSATMTNPAEAEVVNTQTPTFVGTFFDPQMNNPIGDKMSAYALEVVRVADDEIMWGGAGAVFAATTEERAAHEFTRQYAGATLPTGTGPYEVRAKVYDDSGAGSLWSDPRIFSINAAGQVDLSSVTLPPAKVETASGEIDWQGRWHHPTGLAMNAARVRVWMGEDTIIKTGNLAVMNIASSAQPGTLFTITDLLAGIGTLAPGQDYSYQIQGRATDGLLGPYSARRAFVVNSPPTRPSNLQPPEGSMSSDIPIAEWEMDDPDPDDVLGVDVDSEIQLVRPNGTSITITSTDYDPDLKKWVREFTTSEVLSAVRGLYEWRVRGRDLSAGALGLGDWSKWQSFEYVSGPVVEIDNPAPYATVDTSVPLITWDVVSGTQERYQVRIYEVDSNREVNESREKVGNDQSFRIPAGWLRNKRKYDAEVSIWNGANQEGISLRQQFTVSYTDPAQLTNVEVSPYANRFDPIFGGAPEGSSVLISWDQTNLPPAEFAGYIIRRRRAVESEEEAVRFDTILNPGQTRWVDHMARPNVPLIYSVSQLRRVSIKETLESDPVEIPMELLRRVPILCSAIDPGQLRISGMWMANDLSGSFLRDQSLEKAWGSGERRIHMRPPKSSGAKRVQLTITVRGDNRGSLYDHLDAIDDLVESGDVLLWSPPRNRERMFCVLEGESKWKRSGIDKRTREFVVIQVDWREGLQRGE